MASRGYRSLNEVRPEMHVKYFKLTILYGEPKAQRMEVRRNYIKIFQIYYPVWRAEGKKDWSTAGNACKNTPNWLFCMTSRRRRRLNFDQKCMYWKYSSQLSCIASQRKYKYLKIIYSVWRTEGAGEWSSARNRYHVNTPNRLSFLASRRHRKLTFGQKCVLKYSISTIL